jgi:sulfatase maturation enzyme AslB (radical SAM superfamily)
VQDFCLREHHFAVKKAIKSTILLTTNSDLFCYKEELFNNLIQHGAKKYQTLIIKILNPHHKNTKPSL